MIKKNIVVLAGIIGLSLMIPGNILSSYAQTSEYYQDNGYNEEYNTDKTYDENYDYGSYDKKYDQHDNKKSKLIIDKKIFLCKGDSITATDSNTAQVNNGQDFCFNLDRGLGFSFGGFVDCQDNPYTCKEAGIKHSDFFIKVYPGVTGSPHPALFKFNEYEVSENFRLDDVGDIACFFIGKETGKKFDNGGFIETKSGKVLFVCTIFEGDCKGGFDDKKLGTYSENDYGYIADKKCTVENYVITVFDKSLQDATTEMGILLTTQIRPLSEISSMINTLGQAGDTLGQAGDAINPFN